MNATHRSHAHNNTWDFFNEFDNVVTNLFRPLQNTVPASNHDARVPYVDISETDSSYTITAELPGVGKDNIEVSIDDGVLTLSAQVNSDTQESTTSEARVLRKERRAGKFERSLRLGDDVDESGIQASYVDGVLFLTLPKAAKSQPRKIVVDAA